MNEGDSRFIDDGADGLIWPDKPEPLTERQKKIQAAMMEAIRDKRPIMQVLKEKGIEL